jgi:hypothetical protein
VSPEWFPASYPLGLRHHRSTHDTDQRRLSGLASAAQRFSKLPGCSPFSSRWASQRRSPGSARTLLQPTGPVRRARALRLL